MLCRRTFLRQASLATIGLAGSTYMLTAATKKHWRAGIIGSTGRGDYGHGLDLAFSGVDNVELVALSDADETGRLRAAKRAAPMRQYADYREMLEKEKLELVVVAPRWSEDHFQMAKASLENGCHLLTEKPFTVTLTEADQLLSMAKRKGLKIAVAHQMRLAPSVVHLRRALADGQIGELVHLRAWGKQDARAGGEDLLVLGTHIFDLMRLLAGNALFCTAQAWSRGHPLTRADRRAATERIGPVAGDEIETQFGFTNNVTASFTSRGRLHETLGPWGVECLGSRGALRVLMDVDPIVLQRRRTRSPTGVSWTEDWVPLDEDPSLHLASEQRGFAPANRRVVLDWVDSIARDHEPQCSGENATKALEMVMATYESALQHRPVAIPLTRRDHPLLD